jgi:hypothetical protein
MDTDANRNLYGHAYRNAIAYCHLYCHTDADCNAAPYGHAHRDADVYRYCN